MKKNKKAVLETSTLVLYILLVATTLTLAGAVTMFTRLATKDAAKKACELDINKAVLSKQVPAAGKLLSRGHQQTSLTNCRRDKLGNSEIKYKDIVENGVINQDKAHKIIADEMVECWKMVGEGRVDPFSNWDNDNSAYCMICTTIKFDEKLQDYYIDSLSDEKLAIQRGKNGVIQHPIPWMIKNDFRKDESYYEFVYKSKPKYLSEDLNKMEKQFITEDTAIILKLFKYKDQDTWTVIARVGTIIVGVVIFVVGLALTLTGIGAIIGIPLKGLAVIMIGGIAISVVGTIAWEGGIAMFDPVNVNPYADCKECQGVGSMKIIPPQFDIAQKVTIEYKIEGEDSIKEEGPYCKIIVN